MKNEKVKEEIGKWLMDIAKYITTAVLLSSVFGKVREFWAICIYAALTVALTLTMGIFFIKNKKEDK